MSPTPRPHYYHLVGCAYMYIEHLAKTHVLSIRLDYWYIVSISRWTTRTKTCIYIWHRFVWMSLNTSPYVLNYFKHHILKPLYLYMFSLVSVSLFCFVTWLGIRSFCVVMFLCFGDCEFFVGCLMRCRRSKNEREWPRDLFWLGENRFLEASILFSRVCIDSSLYTVNVCLDMCECDGICVRFLFGCLTKQCMS